MAVYREGFSALETIERASVRIYDDACDYGALTKQGDSIWNAAKQLVDWYKDHDNQQRMESIYSTGKTVSNIVELMDEWAVSDGRLTVRQATKRFKVVFVKVNQGIKKQGKVYEGYVYVEELN